MIQAIEYTSAEALRQAANETRQRMWGNVKPKNIAMAAKSEIVIVDPPQQDQHVKAYRIHRARVLLGFEPPVMPSIKAPEPVKVKAPEVQTAIIFEDEAPSDTPTRKTMRQIAMDVLRFFPKVSLDDIVGPRRRLPLIFPRHLCMYEIYNQRPDLPTTTIGKFFNRDHTVVLYAVHKIGSLAEGGEKHALWIENKGKKAALVKAAWRDKTKRTLYGDLQESSTA